MLRQEDTVLLGHVFHHPSLLDDEVEKTVILFPRRSKSMKIDGSSPRRSDQNPWVVSSMKGSNKSIKEGNWLRSWAKKRIEENQRWLRSTRKLIVGCSSVESKDGLVKKSDQVEHCVVFCGHGHDVCVTQLSGASGHEKAVCVIEWSIGHEGNDISWGSYRFLRSANETESERKKHVLSLQGPKVENDSIIWAHRIKGKAELSWQSFRRQDTLGLVGAAGHNKSKPKTDQGSLPAKPIGERAKQLKALRSLRTKDGACKVDRAPVV
ncbi:hypothetical protein HID58_004030 [Brassica napus]|uniref:Uncharacterized protein n=1 Tax=Brassica napus TaxID=3708 RepID=A0ABQ7XIA9_BRANA|nr:hypothetical protein HID58_004030 [Brassica napus]